MGYTPSGVEILGCRAFDCLFGMNHSRTPETAEAPNPNPAESKAPNDHGRGLSFQLVRKSKRRWLANGCPASVRAGNWLQIPSRCKCRENTPGVEIPPPS